MRTCRNLLPSIISLQQRRFLPNYTSLLLTSGLILSLRNTNSFTVLGQNKACSSFSTSSLNKDSSSAVVGVAAGTGSDKTANSSTRIKSMSEGQEKSVDDLRIQWAGGRDVWPKVPIDDSGGGRFISIQTKVKKENTDITNDNDDHNNEKSSWPEIVKKSTLYGFGAYNPRGKTFPLEINEKQHSLLHQDIQRNLAQYPESIATYWEGASVWEDGSSEKGFILAFREKEDEGLQLSIDLARKYDQGAIYQFRFENGSTAGDGINGRLMRDTVAVLDEGSDARVEVEIDDSSIDLSPFL